MIFVYLCTMEQEFASTLLENAVSEFAQLPGIGRKTALRLVLYLLKQNEDVATRFGESIIKLRKEIRYCRVCHNISETDVCPICSNPARDRSTVCVVENVKDVMSIWVGSYRPWMASALRTLRLRAWLSECEAAR